MSQPLGVDYSFGRPLPGAIRRAGFAFVCRYLSHDPAKNISRAEAAALHAAGLGIVLIWEDSGSAAIDGIAAGRRDAHAAAQQAAGLGVPKSVPIYFAVDFDVLSSEMAAVRAYFIGVGDVLGASRAGVYGDYHVLESVQMDGLVRYGWQTLAWSGGLLASAAHIYQFSNDHTVGGAAVDFNRAERAEYGAWTPPSRTVFPHGVAAADLDVDLGTGEWSVKGKWTVVHRAHFGVGTGVGHWDVEPLPAEGEWWCAKVRVHRGRP